MKKYEKIKLIVLKKNKALTNYILLYIRGNGPCKYLQNIAYCHILNELQYDIDFVQLFNFLDTKYTIDIT